MNTADEKRDGAKDEISSVVEMVRPAFLRLFYARENRHKIKLPAHASVAAGVIWAADQHYCEEPGLMKRVTIVNCSNAMILGAYIQVAETKAERLKGLLGTQCLPCGHGLLLRPCNGVHTFGMKYPIDVIFLDEEYSVLEIVVNMPPRNIARCYVGRMVLELPAGTVEQTYTEVGHRLREDGYE